MSGHPSDSVNVDTDAFAPQRRERRLPCRLAAVVEGIAKGGNFLHEEAQCVSISRKGACVVSKMSVEIGDQVALVVPAINPERRELMRVAWKREIEGETHIGLGPIDEETNVFFGEDLPGGEEAAS